MSRQVSGAEIVEKKTLLCGKVCFGLITAAVKPGANISLQSRAGIEQNRKGRPTQIVIGLQSTTSTFGPIICLFHSF